MLPSPVAYLHFSVFPSRGPSEVKKKEGGAGREQTETQIRADGDCQLFVQGFPRASWPVSESSGGRRLGLPVVLDVALRRFRCMMRCVMMVTVRQVGMVRGGFMFACFVVFGCFLMMACCVFVMFRRLVMMVCCLLRHSFIPPSID